MPVAPSGSPGRLDRAQQLRYARRAYTGLVKGLPGLVRASTGHGPLGGPQPGWETPPDTALTRQASELARAAYTQGLLNHCLRCYHFGLAFAAVDGRAAARRTVDREAFYVACLMHDLALTPDFTTPPDIACFAVHGGQVAREHLLSWGADSAFAATVAEAIALHLDVTVPYERGPEAHLLHEGAHLDVGGIRVGDLPRSVLVDVVTRFPNAGFAHEFLDIARREARERPDSRAAVMWRGGMRVPVSLNPLFRLTRG